MSNFFNQAANAVIRDKLLVVELSFSGCTGCLNLDVHNTLSGVDNDEDIVLTGIPWRSEDYPKIDFMTADDPNEYMDYKRYPVQDSYVFFEAVVWDQKQRLTWITNKNDGNRLHNSLNKLEYDDPKLQREFLQDSANWTSMKGKSVQTYSDGNFVKYGPDGDPERPHFPQIFFIDPSRIDRDYLIQLCQAHYKGNLLKPTNARTKAALNSRGLSSFEEQFESTTIGPIKGLFQSGSIIAQLGFDELFPNGIGAGARPTWNRKMVEQLTEKLKDNLHENEPQFLIFRWVRYGASITLRSLTKRNERIYPFPVIDPGDSDDKILPYYKTDR